MRETGEAPQAASGVGQPGEGASVSWSSIEPGQTTEPDESGTADGGSADHETETAEQHAGHQHAEPGEVAAEDGDGGSGDATESGNPEHEAGIPEIEASDRARWASSTYGVPTPDDMRALGWELARFLRLGDLVLLTGELGAGKTTLVQGIGVGLGVRRQVTSPTFVIARVHPPSPGGLPLVHADAYRIGGVAEIDDLDLETPAEEAVTVVEWGEGLAEDLAEDRLEVTISLGEGEERLVRVTGVGRRWATDPLFR